MLYSLHEWDNKFIYSICLLHLECEFNANTFSISTYVNVIRIFKELDEQLQWHKAEANIAKNEETGRDSKNVTVNVQRAWKEKKIK